MSLPTPDLLRKARIKYAEALEEKARREERARQSDLGEKGRLGGLIHFVRYFWHVLEPNTPLVEGEPMYAIILHLEAVTRGEIKRLLINVSPGSAKSLLCNVFHPCWEWSAAGMPWLRYVTFAYAAYLTERDNQRFRDIIQTQDFKELWGHVFRLTSEGQIKPANDAKGWKFSSSIKGVGTGERGHRILCFPGDELVATEHGPIPIGKLVEERAAIRAWSFNPSTHSFELKPIIGWHRNPGRALVKVTLESGATVTCTHNHDMFTAEGPMPASQLSVGTPLVVANPMIVRAECKVQMLMGESLSQGVHRTGTNTKSLGERQSTFRVSDRDLLGDFIGKERCAAPTIRHERQCKVQMPPLTAGAYGVDRSEACVEPHRDVPYGLRRIVREQGCCYLADHLLRKMRRTILPSAVSFAVRNVVGPSAVLKIARRWISRVAVLMADLIAWWAWPDERLCYQPVHHSIAGLPIDPQANTWIPLIGRACHDLAGQHHGVTEHIAISPRYLELSEASFSVGNARKTAHSTQARNFVVPFVADNLAPLFDRVISVEHVPDIPPHVYCLTVESNHTLCCGSLANIAAKNCDDLHSVKEGESEAIRSETVRWAREGMSNRLNDMEEGVIIMIGQRVHDEDVSNTMLEIGGYVHLSIANEYDPQYHCATAWWEDPRTELGQLAWPERFPAHVTAGIKAMLGPSAYASQYLQHPEPPGGGILKRSFWKEYELPIGATPPHQFDLIIASLDPAYTSRQENDPSGFVVCGVYRDKADDPHVVLLHAWKKWLDLHGQDIPRGQDEGLADYVGRASSKWGLVEQVAHDCARLKVRILLVEDKASGHSVAQEIQRLYSTAKWSCLLVDPGGLDKRARAYAVQHLFAGGMFEVPVSWQCTKCATQMRKLRGGLDYICPKCPDGQNTERVLLPREWAAMVVDEAAKFRGLPGDEDNIVDALTQCAKWMRDNNVLIRPVERQFMERELATYRKPLAPLYPGSL